MKPVQLHHFRQRCLGMVAADHYVHPHPMEQRKVVLENLYPRFIRRRRVMIGHPGCMPFVMPVRMMSRNRRHGASRHSGGHDSHVTFQG
jgi:hypothetical protein